MLGKVCLCALVRQRKGFNVCVGVLSACVRARNGYMGLVLAGCLIVK